MDKNFQRWTARRRVELVLDILRGKLDVSEACRKWQLSEGDVRDWVDSFMRAGEEGLKRPARGRTNEPRPRVASSRPATPLRKQPHRRMSRQIVEAIGQACLRILAEEGPDALSTNRVAKLAGVSIGSLYYYFPDKRAIIDVVFREEFERALGRNQGNYRRTLLRQFAELSLPAALDHFIASVLDRHRRMLQLEPRHYVEHLRDYDFDRILRDLYPNAQTTEAWLDFLLDLHPAEIADQENRELKVFVAMRALMGALNAVIEERPHLLEQTALSKELVTLILRYFRYTESG